MARLQLTLDSHALQMLAPILRKGDSDAGVCIDMSARLRPRSLTSACSDTCVSVQLWCNSCNSTLAPSLPGGPNSKNGTYFKNGGFQVNPDAAGRLRCLTAGQWLQDRAQSSHRTAFWVHSPQQARRTLLLLLLLLLHCQLRASGRC